ncbi:MAG: polysaccharide biosynthesis tyrosine autokinase, partial [Bacteroidales bacterium]|nr:polysaccharide biosynthesis tyrosine autokinase [Bacteroidales bacterium]
QLYNTRTELLFTSTEKNPIVLSLEKQIQNTKKALIENINNIINTSTIAINDINRRISELSDRINRLPKTQRNLISIQRKFKLNDAIYTYLLERRSEAQITKASNITDNEIIDKARTSGQTPVYPKKSLNYIIAIILGLVFPVIYILGKDYFNDKIIERKDVENITNLPIIGHIIHSAKESNIVVAKSPKSSISESFRSIRTNLQYITKGKEKQVVLITSDMVAAGKTFVAINLASIFAQYDKKTLLIGFDLRKPKIYQDFGLTNTEGISSYLINKSKFEDIIQKSSIKNLDIIMGGPVPPNPSELIASSKTTELFNKLKEIYDFIIIDTPPVGLVTDAFLVMKYTDANLFIVRQNFTNKKIFESIIKDVEQRKLPNINILINDVKLT